MPALITRNRFPRQFAPQPGALVGRSELLNGFVDGWPIAEGAGTALNSIWGSHPLTLHGGTPMWASSPMGMAFNMDGSTNYADSNNINGIASLIGQTSPWTVAIWFMTTTPATRQAVIADWNSVGQQQSMTIEIGGFNQVAGHITTNVNAGGAGGVYVDSGVSAAAGLWYHAVVTFGGGTITIYVNGVQKALSGPWADPGGGTTMALGRGGAFAALYVAGGITLPLLWKRALSPAEVWDLYTSPYGIFQPLVTIYRTVGASITSAIFPQRTLRGVGI